MSCPLPVNLPHPNGDFVIIPKTQVFGTWPQLPLEWTVSPITSEFPTFSSFSQPRASLSLDHLILTDVGAVFLPRFGCGVFAPYL